jgi:hypothetical protein
MPIYPYSFQLPPLNVQDIPNNGVAGEFLGISAGGVLDWLPVATTAGDMLKSENLSGLASYPTARTNLGLGTTDTPTFKNLVISTGTIATSAPVTISQTWDALAVAFTAFKVNATSTNSAAASLLADFQVGGVSKAVVLKSGEIRSYKNTTDYAALVPALEVSGFLNSVGTTTKLRFDDGGGAGGGSGLFLGISGVVAWHDRLRTDQTAPDTILLRDGAANTLALRNGAAAQTFNVYGTYTSGTSYERLTLSAPSAANAIIGTNKGSGGGTARGLDFHTDGAARWTISTAGHLLAAADNTYDIGASGANRPRDIYAGGNFVGSGGYLLLGVSGGISKVQLDGRVTNNLTLTNNSQSDFGRLNFGAAADTHPAIARDGAGIKFTGAAAGSTSWIKVPPVAVSALPAAATAGVGARAFVNDASTPVFGSAVTGGGAVAVPVYSTGSAWNVG